MDYLNEKKSQEQYDKMLLLYSHIKQLEKGVTYSPHEFYSPREINKELVLSFFIRTHHMIDWAKEKGNKNTRRLLHRVINDCIPLKICSDICNQEKHCDLDKPRFEQPGCFKLKVQDEVLECFSSEVPSLRKYIAYYTIENNSDIYSVMFLAESCISIWREILEANIKNDLSNEMNLLHFE